MRSGASRIGKGALTAIAALGVAASSAVAMAALGAGSGPVWAYVVLGGVVLVLCAVPVLLYLRLRGALDVAVETVRTDARIEVAQAAALTALHGFLGPGFLLPSHRRWAASPDLLVYLCGTLLRTAPRVIVEAGCGASTLVLAACIRRLGLTARLVSLEEDAAHAAETSRLLISLGLAEAVQVVHAPLVDHTVGGMAVRWYDLAGVASVAPIDLLVVDGPSGVRTPDPWIRYGALPLLRNRLSKYAAVVMDDARRPAEQRVIRRWCEEFPEFELEFVAHEKGTAVLTRRIPAVTP